MAITILFSSFLYGVILVFLLFSSNFAILCTSNKFSYENNHRLLSEGQLDQSSVNNRPFPSLPVNAIYQFGDSLADTGNVIQFNPSDNCAKTPYGESYFDKPTGRCSDGLLMIDYFAKFMKIPMLDAYLNKEGDFRHGVNFAVGGASALNASVLKLKYNTSVPTNFSLSVQLDWFKNFKSHIHSYYIHESDRRNKISKGLFFMGEIGGNDYNFAILKGISLPDVYKMVPDVVQAITNAVEEIIELGATQIAIPGNFPIGCIPVYLNLFKTNNSNMYDELKCLKKYNKHAQYHNEQLQKAIVKLQKGHPKISIVYMDYYGAFTQILQHPTSFGFDEGATRQACCGEGENEYNVGVNCGTKGVFVCENPQKHISWDGLHLTQQAYHVLAKHLMPSLSHGVTNICVYTYLTSIIMMCLIIILEF